MAENFEDLADAAELVFVARPDLLASFVNAMSLLMFDECALRNSQPPMFV